MLVKDLNATHPTHSRRLMREYMALYHGGERFHAEAPRWLHQLPEELPESWAARIDRATYENHSGPICDLLAGALFTQPPKISEFGGTWYEDFSKNVDGDHTPVDVWFRQRMVDALRGGVAYAWIDLPDRQGLEVADRATEEARGFSDARLVHIEPEQVIDWEVDERGCLLWVLIADIEQRRETPMEKRVTAHRWTAITRERIIRWRWIPQVEGVEPTAEDVAKEYQNVPHNLGEIPVVRMQLPSGLHAMGKLRDPALELLRAQHDVSWALHKGAHPLLWVATEWGDDAEEMVLGPGRFLRLNETDSIGYAEPSGVSFGLLAERTVALRDGLYRIVHQMAVSADTSTTRVAQSAKSKAEDWRAMETVLTAYAGLMRPFIRETLRLVSKSRDKTAEETPDIAGLEGWGEDDVQTWLDAAASAPDAIRMSPTFARAVAKTQVRRLMPGLEEDDMKKIDAEIDAADPTPMAFMETGLLMDPDDEGEEEEEEERGDQAA